MLSRMVHVSKVEEATLQTEYTLASLNTEEFSITRITTNARNYQRDVEAFLQGTSTK